MMHFKRIKLRLLPEDTFQKLFSDSKIVFIILISFLALFYCLYVFLLKATIYIDLDFGWQVRMGDWILKNGIPLSDPLTYTMPSYPYIDHEWLTNIFFYLSTTYVGIPGLAIIFVSSVVIAIFLQINKRFTVWALLPLLLSFTTLVTFFGIRAQVLGWIFFSIILKITFNEKLWKKWKFLAPLTLLVWSNMHGSFGMGILVLAVFNLNLLLEKRFTRVDLVVFILSITATFINPYGYKVWVEVLTHLSNSFVKDRLGEWMPLLYTFNHESLFYLLYILTSYLLIIFTRANIKLYKIILLTAVLFASFSSVRHIPFYILLSFPLLIDSFYFMHKKWQKNKALFTRRSLAIFYSFVLIAVFQIASVENVVETVKEESVYPTSAIKYLQNHMPENQIMSVWEWGGYLDWKLPEKKVFIDGRTLVWNWDKNSKNESNNIYKESELFLLGEIPLQEIAKKYNIDTLLFPVQLLENQSIKKQLSQGDWMVQYKDPVAVIYKKKR